jgi:hypothetical protein
VRAFVEKLQKPRLRFGNGVCRRDADRIKTLLARLRDQRGFDRGCIA